MHYTVRIESDHDMTEDEQLTAIDLMHGTHDSATVSRRSVEIDGSMPTDEHFRHAVAAAQAAGYTVKATTG